MLDCVVASPACPARGCGCDAFETAIVVHRSFQSRPVSIFKSWAVHPALVLGALEREGTFRAMTVPLFDHLSDDAWENCSFCRQSVTVEYSTHTREDRVSC